MKVLIKILIVTSFSLSVLVNIFSQDAKTTIKIDSLNNELKKAKNDTVKAKIYYLLFLQYRKYDNLKAIETAKIAEKLAQSKGSPKLIGVIKLKMSGIYYDIQNYELSSKYALESLNQFEKIKFNKGIIESLNIIGNVYCAINQLEEGLLSYKKALSIALSINDTANTCILYSNIGAVYGEIAQLENEKLKIEKKYDFKEISKIFYNKNTSSLLNQNLDSAIKYLKLKISQFENSDSINKINIKYQLIVAYSLKSIESIEYSNKYARTDYIKSMNYANISGIYSFFNDWQQVILNNKKALLFSNKDEGSGMYITELTSVGLGYLNLNKFELAKEFLDSALVIAVEKKMIKNIAKIYDILALYYEKKADYKNAYHCQILLKKYSDSILNNDISQKILELNAKYKYEKSQNEILILNKTIKNKNTIIFVIIFSLVFAIFITSLILILLKQKSINIKQQKIIFETEKQINDLQLYNSKLENENIKKEIAYKNSKLIQLGLIISEKNEILQKFKEIIEKNENSNQLKEAYKNITYSLQIDKEIETFNESIENVHEKFFLELENRYPNLTKGEKRLLAILMMDLTSKEIANILNISHASVNIKRHRLRQKLEIETDEDIYKFLKRISNTN